MNKTAKQEAERRYPFTVGQPAFVNHQIADLRKSFVDGSNWQAQQPAQLPPQGTYYREVSVSEGLPTRGCFPVKIEGTDLIFNAYIINGHISHNNVTHWLEPFTMPDLRQIAEKAFEAGENYGINSATGRADEMNRTAWLNEHYPEGEARTGGKEKINFSFQNEFTTFDL